jgi:hypothetical protein
VVYLLDGVRASLASSAQLRSLCTESTQSMSTPEWSLFQRQAPGFCGILARGGML